MNNPPHPGEIIRDLYLEPLGLSITEAAAGLGVARKTLSLSFGRTPEAWLPMQMKYDPVGRNAW